MTTKFTRRRFLQHALATGLLTATGAPLLAAAPQRSRVLVLVELKGANDGLNTVIPYADPAYRSLRPNLAIARDAVVQLDETRGLHPAMKPLLPLWQRGELAIIEGLGYPSPNRSHFRSIDIWESASGADAFLGAGWLSPYLQSRTDQRFVALGEDAGPMAGSPENTLLIGNFDAFVNNAQRLRQLESATPNPALRHLLSVQNSMQSAALAFAESSQQYTLKTPFPSTGLARDLAKVAELIATQPSVGIYKVGLAGFDTHANQLPRHRRLLDQLSTALAAFATEMRAQGRWQDVLVMTYSEFGRRAVENGSGGTDHGTAAPHLLVGGAVSGGFFGQTPSLTRLSQDDLEHTTDYRCYYRTVARNWLGFDQISALRDYRPISGIIS